MNKYTNITITLSTPSNHINTIFIKYKLLNKFLKFCNQTINTTNI